MPIFGYHFHFAVKVNLRKSTQVDVGVVDIT